MTNLPSRPPLDRSALERVLARAAELQARDADTGEGALSEEQILELGKEVGLSPSHLRQALAEERTRVALPEETGVMAGALGAAVVSARRVVPGTQAAVLGSLHDWMTREECLREKRRFSDRILWEPGSGLVATFQRGFNVGGRGYHLARAHEVAATVIPVDDARAIVQLDADLSNVRAQRLASGGAVATVGLLAAVPVAMLAVALPVLAIVPAALGLTAGWATARSYRGQAARVQLALEQILDRLERGERPRPSLRDMLATGRLPP